MHRWLVLSFSIFLILGINSCSNTAQTNVEANIDTQASTDDKADLGNKVWIDNGDGIKQRPERGFANVSVKLYLDANNDGNPDSRTAFKQTITDSGGYYRFNAIDPDKNYLIEVIAPTGYKFAPKHRNNSHGKDFDSDINPSTGFSDSLDVEKGRYFYWIDAALVLSGGSQEPASVGDKVWIDSNADGIKQKPEPGFANIKVNLWIDSNNDNKADKKIATTKTNNAGNYKFSNLNPSLDYYIEIIPASGYVFSKKHNSAAPGKDWDSDINPATGFSDKLELKADKFAYWLADAGLSKKSGQSELDKQLKALLAAKNVVALDKLDMPDSKKVELGRLLMHDKELSGNRDISCASCHTASLFSGDELSLSIGTGGKGSGHNRIMGQNRDRVPRNAPDLFNRGYADWAAGLFWDSRVKGDASHGFSTPAGTKLPKGLDNVIAAQAMFPVLAREEMMGNSGDKDINGKVNEIALIPDSNPNAAWGAIMKRILAIGEYQNRFKEVYPNIPLKDLGFQHAANAIAAFEISAYTKTNTPFDSYLKGNLNAINDSAKRGGVLFFGEFGCGECHNGPMLTDHLHHNIGVPQLGPGVGSSAPLDEGLFLKTNNPADKFAFRTPQLRNVALTGPWMHNGAYTSLEAAVRHYDDPLTMLREYDSGQLAADLQDTVHNNFATMGKIVDTLSPLVNDRRDMSDAQVADVIAFLNSLTDPSALDMSNETPATVPSGLPVAD